MRICVALVLVVGCKAAEKADADTRERVTLPASCAQYREALDALPACGGVTKDELAAFWRGYQDASTAWLNRDLSRMPPSTMRAIDLACTKGRETIHATVARWCPERSPRVEEDLFANRSQLPQTCVDYGRMMDSIRTCEKLPQRSRDALDQGYDAMARSWSNVDQMPLEARKALEDACTAGRDALQQVGESAGCELSPIGNLPKECNEYRGWILRLTQCDKMPAQSRDALRQGFESMSQAWRDAGMLPPEARKAMADACTQGTEALKQTAGAMCGW